MSLDVLLITKNLRLILVLVTFKEDQDGGGAKSICCTKF